MCNVAATQCADALTSPSVFARQSHWQPNLMGNLWPRWMLVNATGQTNSTGFPYVTDSKEQLGKLTGLQYPEKEPAGEGVPEGLTDVRAAMPGRHRSKRSPGKVPNWPLNTHTVMAILRSHDNVDTKNTKQWELCREGEA